MNGVVVRRAVARMLCLSAVGLLPACQSYQTFSPSIASSPIVGPAGKVALADQPPVEGGVVTMPGKFETNGGTFVHSSTVSNGSFCSDCGSSCSNGRCRNGCHTSFKDKLRECDWEQLRTDHCWPTQYNYESRRRVNQPLHDQIAAGHATHNTLHDLHFDNDPEKRGELHSAGKERIKYLARRRPYVVPTIFVQTSFDAAVDAEREKNIRDFAAKVSTEATPWNVVMVNTAPSGLFGVEGAASIEKMVGAQQGRTIPSPKYETVLKNGFFQGTGGGQAVGGAGS